MDTLTDFSVRNWSHWLKQHYRTFWWKMPSCTVTVNDPNLTFTILWPYPIFSLLKKLFTLWKKSMNLDMLQKYFHRYLQFLSVCNSIIFEKKNRMIPEKTKWSIRTIQYLKLISILILIRCPENKSNKSPSCPIYISKV